MLLHIPDISKEFSFSHVLMKAPLNGLWGPILNLHNGFPHLFHDVTKHLIKMCIFIPLPFTRVTVKTNCSTREFYNLDYTDDSDPFSPVTLPSSLCNHFQPHSLLYMLKYTSDIVKQVWKYMGSVPP